MTWIILDNVHVWKLIHVCYLIFFYYFQILELDSLLSKFYGSIRTKKSMNEVYKTNIDSSFVRGMVENYCALGKIQPWPPIHLGPAGLGE